LTKGIESFLQKEQKKEESLKNISEKRNTKSSGIEN